MTRDVDRRLRGHRAALVVVGVLLAAVAVAGLLLSTEAIGGIGDSLDADTAVLNDDGLTFVIDHRFVLQLVGFVVGVVLVWIGLSWLRHQIPRTRRHQQDNVFETPEHTPGRNTVRGGALAMALEDDLERSRHIRRARAEFRTTDDLLRLRLDVDDDTDVATILRSSVDPAIDRITTVAELPRRPDVQIDLRPLEPAGDRVV